MAFTDDEIRACLLLEGPTVAVGPDRADGGANPRQVLFKAMQSDAGKKNPWIRPSNGPEFEGDEW